MVESGILAETLAKAGVVETPEDGAALITKVRQFIEKLIGLEVKLTYAEVV